MTTSRALMFMSLSPTSLKLFLAVMEHGTIAAAAKEHHIAAAAISKRISELEEHLNVTLLIRTNKGVRPTSAGAALQVMARQALQELNQIPLQMQDYAQGKRGIVRVWANISAITQFLPQDIKNFVVRYPNIKIQLEEKISDAVIRGIQDNAADVGIFSGIAMDYGIKIHRYKEDTLCLITPAGHPLIQHQPLRFFDALHYPFIGLHNGSSLNHMVAQQASNLDLSINIRVHVTGFDALCFMVDSGLGLGVLPITLARRYAKIFNIHVLTIHEPWAQRRLHIALPPQQRLPSAAQLFVSHLQANTQA